MSDYTPLDHEVRARAISGGAPFIHRRDGGRASEAEMTAEAEFDRWLAENNRQVAEKAWDEGHRAPQYKSNLNGDYLGKVGNPYRKEQP